MQSYESHERAQESSSFTKNHMCAEVHTVFLSGFISRSHNTPTRLPKMISPNNRMRSSTNAGHFIKVNDSIVVDVKSQL